MRFLFLIISFFALTAPVFAHWGHVGEVAGHGHWIALGAAVGAAALAAWLVRSREDKETTEDEAAEDAGGEMEEGETA